MARSGYYSSLLAEDDYKHWNDLVEKAEHGTLFHQLQWLKSFDRPLAVIGCYNETGMLVGGMPLTYQNVAGLKIARPPYLTPYLGPIIFKTEGKYHRLLTLEKDITLSLIDFVTTSYDFIRIPLSPNIFDTQPFKQNNFNIEVEYTYVIKLDDLDRIWQELNQDRRRKIRKGRQEGLTCEPGDNLDQFFELLTSSLSAHDKHLSQNRFEEIRSWYQVLQGTNQAQLLLIKDTTGRAYAGAVLVWDSKRAYYLLSGMSRAISSGNAMALLLWECICFCNEKLGVEEFDFDGSEVPSVELFFRGFGGRLIPRFTVTWGRPVTWPIRHGWKFMTETVQIPLKAFTK